MTNYDYVGKHRLATSEERGIVGQEWGHRHIGPTCGCNVQPAVVIDDEPHTAILVMDNPPWNQIVAYPC